MLLTVCFFGWQEDADAMEADLDKQEALRPTQGELYGDRLLNSHYVNTGNASSRKRKVSSLFTI